MENDFFYAQPVKIWFGEGCLDRLDEVLAAFQIERAVLVCGRHFAAAAAALQEKLPAVKAVFSPGYRKIRGRHRARGCRSLGLLPRRSPFPREPA